MGRLGRLAAGTPAGRERYVDLLRAIAIVLVVLGHWLIIEVTHPPGAGSPVTRRSTPSPGHRR
ncbi:hypothetical protein GCM10027605_46600 [Micromonospora zhanjiangensis]